MFQVNVAEREGRWIVEATEGQKLRFVGWYRTRAEAEARREIEFAWLLKKHPSEGAPRPCGHFGHTVSVR